MKPFQIMITSDPKGLIIKEVKFDFDPQDGLCAHTLLGLAVQEFMQEEDLVERMMRRATGRLEMQCQNGDINTPKH